MKIAIGCDHRGFHLKEKVRELLVSKGHAVEDAGADNGTDPVDYPDYGKVVASKVSKGEVDRGILICGTGIGMSLTANKYHGVRAATCPDEITAEISRRHNDLNVLCLSGDMLSPNSAERIVNAWLSTEFEGGRHSRRIGKIAEIEEKKSDC